MRFKTKQNKKDHWQTCKVSVCSWLRGHGNLRGPATEFGSSRAGLDGPGALQAFCLSEARPPVPGRAHRLFAKILLGNE